MADQQLWQRQLCGCVAFEGVSADPSRATCGAAKDDFVFPDVEV
jgi:hypothetical protein